MLDSNMRNYLLFLLFISISFSKERTLNLKSGDKITGNVISETDTTITLTSRIFGEITINKNDLKKEPVTITLKSGDIIKGLVLEKTTSYFVLQTAFGEVRIESGDVKLIKSQKPDEPEKNSQLTPRSTIFGTRWEKTRDHSSEEWYFSKERLADIWFDPTGYTIEKNKLYFSGISWGFGLTDRIQITSKWVNYFWQDFNIRPKFNLLTTGTVDSQISFAIGGHMHTRGLPGKYKWRGEAEENGSIDLSKGRYVRLGATIDEQYAHGWNDDFTNGDKIWYEFFCALTSSKLRDGGNGRFNITIGTSAVFYPNEDVAPRVYAATDIDVSESIKVMAEVFYDEYYPEVNNFESDTKMKTPFHFDIGFITNKIALDDRLWIGVHFQRPFIHFYWKF